MVKANHVKSKAPYSIFSLSPPPPPSLCWKDEQTLFRLFLSLHDFFFQFRREYFTLKHSPVLIPIFYLPPYFSVFLSQSLLPPAPSLVFYSQFFFLLASTSSFFSLLFFVHFIPIFSLALILSHAFACVERYKSDSICVFVWHTNTETYRNAFFTFALYAPNNRLGLLINWPKYTIHTQT